jgi:gamma-tubulin complex component 3
MVPSFIPLTQAKKILATGKSINFLREICQDHTPVKGREELKHALESTSGKFTCSLSFLCHIFQHDLSIH